MARQVFLQRITKEAASRSFGSSRKALRAPEDLVRNRNSSFHTDSMTGQTGDGQSLGLPQIDRERLVAGGTEAKTRKESVYGARATPRSVKMAAM